LPQTRRIPVIDLVVNKKSHGQTVDREGLFIKHFFDKYHSKQFVLP